MRRRGLGGGGREQRDEDGECSHEDSVHTRAGPRPRRFADCVYPATRPRARRSPTLYRPALRACAPAAVLLAVPASLAFAKPSFETGPYYGNVALKSKPVVQFTATRKRVKQLDVDPQQVTCRDGAKGALNLPGTPAKRSLKVTRGRFGMTVKAAGADPEYAGTKLTGRLRGRTATGTIRIIYRKPSPTDPQGVKCDTGKRRWTARLDEIVVELPR